MLNKKLKLSIIVIATLVAGNVNAQAYYSCIPEGCPNGQYFDGKKCHRLCPENYVWDGNNAACYKEYCDISFTDRKACKVKYTSNTGITATCERKAMFGFNKARIPYKDCIGGICCNERL